MFRRVYHLYRTNPKFISSRFFSKKKTQFPTRLTVTPENEQLQVNVFDENNEQSLGRMSLIQAERIGKLRQLLLVQIDQSVNPLNVHLMTGRRLAEIREDIRSERSDDPFEDKDEEFTVRLRSHIADNDLQTKMSQAHAANSRGCTLRILIEFDRDSDSSNNKHVKEQNDFLERLKPYLDEFPKVHTNSRGAHSMIFIVPSPQSIDRSTRKHDRPSN